MHWLLCPGYNVHRIALGGFYSPNTDVQGVVLIRSLCSSTYVQLTHNNLEKNSATNKVKHELNKQNYINIAVTINP